MLLSVLDPHDQQLVLATWAAPLGVWPALLLRGEGGQKMLGTTKSAGMELRSRSR